MIRLFFHLLIVFQLIPKIFTRNINKLVFQLMDTIQKSFKTHLILIYINI